MRNLEGKRTVFCAATPESPELASISTKCAEDEA